MKRLAKTVMGAGCFQDMLTTGAMYKTIKGLPKGAEFRGWGHNPLTNEIHTFWEHESFKECYDGGQPLIMEVEVERVELDSYET